MDPAPTRALLVAQPELAACTETRCLALLASLLGADAVISGVVGGLGGFQTLVLKRTDREGRVVTSVSEALGEDEARVPALVCAVFGRAPACWDTAALVAPPPPALAARSAASPSTASTSTGLGPKRVVGVVASGAALASLGVALGFGLSAQSLSGEIERQQTGCVGADAAGCLESRFSTGRSHATLSNVFWGLGAALGVTGVVLLALPSSSSTGGTVALGPGPTPAGLSAHGTF
jgi:hypothetical protein